MMLTLDVCFHKSFSHSTQRHSPWYGHTFQLCQVSKSLGGQPLLKTELPLSCLPANGECKICLQHWCWGRCQIDQAPILPVHLEESFGRTISVSPQCFLPPLGMYQFQKQWEIHSAWCMDRCVSHLWWYQLNKTLNNQNTYTVNGRVIGGKCLLHNTPCTLSTTSSLILWASVRINFHTLFWLVLVRPHWRSKPSS